MKILLLGDSLFNNDSIELDQSIIRVCNSADLLILNLEGPITMAPSAGTRPRPLSQPNAIPYLKDLEVDIAILANNHIMDHGIAGLRDTMKALESNGIGFVGVGDDDEMFDVTRVRHGDESIVILAYAHNEGPMYHGIGSCGPISLPKSVELAARLEMLREEGHFIIVSYHGGEEFFSVPWPRRRGYLRWLREAGADLVFAHHAHTVQPVEYDEGGAIVYGAGNFVMDTPYQRMYPGTDTGYIIQYDTVERSISCWTAKFDRERNVLSVGQRDPSGSLHHIDSAGEEYGGDDIWAAECRSYLFSRRRMRAARSGLLFPFVFALRTMRSGSVRDRDIVLGAIPGLGSFHAKHAYLEGRSGAFGW